MPGSRPSFGNNLPNNNNNMAPRPGNMSGMNPNMNLRPQLNNNSMANNNTYQQRPYNNNMLPNQINNTNASLNLSTRSLQNQNSYPNQYISNNVANNYQRGVGMPQMNGMPQNQQLNRPQFNPNGPMIPMRNNPQQPNNSALLNNPRMPLNSSNPQMMNSYPTQNGLLPVNNTSMQQQQQRGNSIVQQQPTNVQPGYNQYGANSSNMMQSGSSLLPHPANSYIPAQTNPNVAYQGYNQQQPTTATLGGQSPLLPTTNMNMMPGQQSLKPMASHPHHQHPQMGVNPMQPMMPGQQALQQQVYAQDPYSTYRQQNPPATASMQQQQQHLQSGSLQHTNLSDIEFQEILEKNRIISGSAISRAVQDASNGKFT
jgi:hypothetical protein